MRTHPVVLAAMFLLSPLGARAADLVVWWQQAHHAQEDEALSEVVAAFEQATGRQVEITLLPMAEQPPASKRRSRPATHPTSPSASGLSTYIPRWALENRLVDLTDTVGHFSNLFDPDQLDRAMLLNAKTGQKALYGLPMGQIRNYINVWTSLLQGAGFSLDDIPKEWEPFWSFWCDQVQPAVRKALGRDDIWGIGRPMSVEANDTIDQFFQFLHAYDADYVTRDGRLVIDEPEIRQRLITAIADYTAVYRKDCTPPDSVSWDDGGNNQAFLAQTVVMTTNLSLSIPNALKVDHPDDYYKNTGTIDWPLGPFGDPFPIEGDSFQVVAFKDGGQRCDREGVRPLLVAEGWLMHYLDFSGERMLPSIPALLDQPFWLDPSDRHHMAAAIQAKTRPLSHQYGPASGDLRHDQVYNERVWAKAIHRVAPKASAPSRRSTRRSPGSSRSWPSRRKAAGPDAGRVSGAHHDRPLQSLACELAELVLKDYRAGEADFTDALIGLVNRRSGCAATATFERKAGELGGFRLL